MNWNKFDWNDENTWPPARVEVLWQGENEFWVSDIVDGNSITINDREFWVSHWTYIIPAPSDAFEKISEGLNEALNHVAGDETFNF